MEDETQDQHVDYDLQNRIHELAQLLDLTRNRGMGVQRENQNSPHEADWAASHLLANLLIHAEVADTLPNRKNVENFLRTKGFEKDQLQSLEMKFWVRFVLGELYIPRSISSAIRAIQNSIRFDSEKEAIDNYAKELGEHKEILEAITAFLKGRNHFWISRVSLEKLRNAHHHAHSRTPTVKRLIELGVIEPCVDTAKNGFILAFSNPTIESEKNLWQVLHKRVFALLWEWLCEDERYTNDVQRLQKWLERTSELDKFYGIEKYVSSDKQERLKRAMQTVLTSEPDIQGREIELEKLRWEHDYGFGNLRVAPLSIKQQSLLDFWNWWKPFEEITWRLGFSRERFDSLIHIAIGNLEYYEKSDFLQSCLNNSFDKPYLFYCAIRDYEHAYRSGMARLLQDSKTVSLGLVLIHEINLRNNSIHFNEDRTHSEIKLQNQKTDLWQRAVSIVCRVANSIIWSSEDGLKKERFDDMITSLSEILLFSAREVYQIERQSETYFVKQELDGSQERFKILKLNLEKLNSFEKYILLIYEWIKTSIAKSKSEFSLSNSMPIAEMKVLFWLLDNSEENSVEAVKIAQGITELYTQEMNFWKVENQGKNFVVSWSDSSHELMEFPWIKIARVLTSIKQLNLLNQPSGLDLISELKSVNKSIKGLVFTESDYPEYSLPRSWLQKIRTHIQVLLRIHSELKPVESTTAKKIETKIRDLISGSANADSDTRQLGLFSHDLDDLYRKRSQEGLFVHQVIRGINRFSADGCKRTFLAWIEKEDYPDVLLAIAEDTVSEDVRKTALERVGQQDLHDYLEKQLFITGYERLLETAVLAGESKVARQILEYMESAKLNDVQQTNWLIFSYRIRLMLAYQEKDLETINTLKFPKFETHVNNRSPEEMRQDFEHIRIFYRALLELTSNPENSYQSFDELFKKEPTSAAYAVNRFAAAVHFAQALTDSEVRKQRLLDALEEWQTATPNFSEDAIKRVSPYLSYSRLAVFDEVEQDLRFDVEWQNLTDDLKIKVPYVDIAVKNALRRNKTDLAEQVYESARPYHTDSRGSIADNFAEIEKRFDGLAKALTPLSMLETTDVGKIEKWRAVWHEITQSRFEQYVRVVGGIDMQPHEFLTQTLLAVFREFLLRKNLFQKANFLEDELGDFVFSLLRMHLRSPWILKPHFSVPDQSRGGSSESGKSPGERDGIIQFGSLDVAIFEALRLKSVVETNITDHVQKAVINYNPTGITCIYIPVYFQGIEWANFWDRYKDHAKSIAFNEYDFDPNHVEPMSLYEPVFSQGLAWICYGYKPRPSSPGDLLRVYHIAINLN
jgi:hypothetical protein